MKPYEYKVLLVDDNSMTINLMSTMLKALGVTNLHVSYHGEDALNKINNALLASTPYHLVFLDWNMPDISGYEVLSQCRQNTANDKTAFVMLTAENQKRSVLEAIKAGATSYIIKPISQDDFSKKLAQIYSWMEERALA
jgi:two-component system chemotaxis response regulator CheY